jgi:hypothetical protein
MRPSATNGVSIDYPSSVWTHFCGREYYRHSRPKLLSTDAEYRDDKNSRYGGKLYRPLRYIVRGDLILGRMPKYTVEVFSEYEADDGISACKILSVIISYLKTSTCYAPGFKAIIAVQANRNAGSGP